MMPHNIKFSLFFFYPLRKMTPNQGRYNRESCGLSTSNLCQLEHKNQTKQKQNLKVYFC